MVVIAVEVVVNLGVGALGVLIHRGHSGGQSGGVNVGVNDLARAGVRLVLTKGPC